MFPAAYDDGGGKNKILHIDFSTFALYILETSTI